MSDPRQRVHGQHPYTDPPPMSRQRFYEDHKPPNTASEQQVRQGRGEPAPYPADEPYERGWRPEQYSDQQSAERPEDSAPPSLAESTGSGMTVAQLLALPREQQDTIIEQLRAQRDNPSGAFEALQGIARQELQQRRQAAQASQSSQPSQGSQGSQSSQPSQGSQGSQPSQQENPYWEWSEQQMQWVPRQQQPPQQQQQQVPPARNPQQGTGGVPSMAPASPGTVIAGDYPGATPTGR